MTWNVTLPVETSSVQSQSDLYTAIWFGMPLTDPFAWLDQCFLELQFYPDSSWTTGTAYGNWVGAAVAWQIEANSGFENPCFYQPLTVGVNGTNAFNMADGDRISVVMNGWIGDRYGENLTIYDLSNGQSSFVNLYNTAQNYPLDPAFYKSSLPNGLQWTPGGEMPAVFAFETGHDASPYPSNNSYGGCSAGPPPPTPRNPSVPCPSYDPGSWANDTAQPWRISAPTFYNASATWQPAQVGFTQDLGGIGFVDYISNGTCAGRDGTSWCSYPWYSYSCGVHAFEFGAVDYPGVSADFGQYNQYTQVFTQDALQLGFYPPTNFSIPACGATTSTVGVRSANPALGAVYFLSSAVPSHRSFPGLGAGEYSVAALPVPGARFQSWTATGGLKVSDPSNPTTSVWVRGDGNLSAAFTTGSVTTVKVTFYEFPTATGSPVTPAVVVSPSFFYTNGTPLATLTNGKSIDLAAGLYSVQAYPASGYNFSRWTVTGGATMTAPGYPYSWLEVDGTSAVNVTAISVSSKTNAKVNYGTWSGTGTVSFDGSASVTLAQASVKVGTYPVKATPSGGSVLTGWLVGSPALMTDYRATTNVTLENGSTYVYAIFGPALVTQTLYSVNLVSASPSAGSISFVEGSPSANQTLRLAAGTYTLTASPNGSYALSSWSVSSSTALWVHAQVGGGYVLQVNASGTATAHFALGSALDLSFGSGPSNGGTIEFNFVNYSSGSTNGSLAAGAYFVVAQPSPGFRFTGWNLTGGSDTYHALTSSSGFVTVVAKGGHLNASFARNSYVVSFVMFPSAGASVALNGTYLTTGSTVRVRSGTEPLLAMPAPSSTFLGWAASAGITVVGGVLANVTIVGAGTVELISTSYTVSASLSPSSVIDLLQSVNATSRVIGPGPFSYLWKGQPNGCTAATLRNLTCRPLVVGNYSITLTVGATDGTSVTVPAGTLRVDPAFVIGPLTISPTNLTLGMATNVTVLTSGGTKPYALTYAGLPLGCAGATSNAFRCTPLTPGVYDLTLIANDSAGFTVFRTGVLTVNEAPSLSAFTSTSNLVDVGMPVTLTAVPAGGTGTLGFSYAGLPSGCASGNAPTLRCVPAAAGLFTITVTVKDSFGYSATASLDLTVNLDPQVLSVTPTPGQLTINQTFSVVTSVNGGTAPFAYAYLGQPPGCLSHNSSTFNCYARQVGTFKITVTVSDRFGRSSSASGNVTIKPESQGTTQNTTGGGSGSGGKLSSTTLAAIGAGVLLLVAVVAALAWRRRSAPAQAPDVLGGETAPEEPASTPSYGTGDDAAERDE